MSEKRKDDRKGNRHKPGYWVAYGRKRRAAQKQSRALEALNMNETPFGIPDNAPSGDEGIFDVVGTGEPQPRLKPTPAQKALHALIVYIDRQGWQDAKLAELVNAGKEALKP